MKDIEQTKAYDWTTQGLGELPDTSYVGDENGYAYTDADMYAYALAQVRRAVAAERERCAKLCEQTGAYTDEIEMAQMCAAAIREA